MKKLVMVLPVILALVLSSCEWKDSKRSETPIQVISTGTTVQTGGTITEKNVDALEKSEEIVEIKSVKDLNFDDTVRVKILSGSTLDQDPSVQLYKSIVNGDKKLSSLIGIHNIKNIGIATLDQYSEVIRVEPTFITKNGKTIGIGYYCFETHEPGVSDLHYKIILLAEERNEYIEIGKQVYSIENMLTTKQQDDLYELATGNDYPAYELKEKEIINAMINDANTKKQVDELVEKVKLL